MDSLTQQWELLCESLITQLSTENEHTSTLKLALSSVRDQSEQRQREFLRT